MIKKRTWILLTLGGAAVLLVGFTRPHEPDLDYLVRWATNDPIFALDGANPNELDHVAKELAAVAQQFAAPYSQPSYSLVADTLYPIAFLESLPALQRAREAFLAKPTQESFGEYYTTLDDSIEKAVAGFEALADTTSLVVGGTTGLFIFADGTTEGSAYPQAIQKLLPQFIELRQRLRNTLACAKNEKWFGCGIANPALPAAPPTPERTLPPQAAHIRALYEQTTMYKGFERKGLISIAESACSPEKPLYFEVLYKGDRVLFLVPLADMRFWDKARADLPNSPQSYEHQIVFNPYLCQDGARVYARVATMLYIRDTLQNQDATGAEADAVTKRDILTEDAVAAYIASNGANPVLRRVWAQQSGYAERVLQSTVLFDRRALEFATDTRSFAQYLFISRATPLVTFFMTNSSFSKKLPTFISPTPPSNIPLLSYYQDLAGTVPDSVLVESINRILIR